MNTEPKRRSVLAAVLHPDTPQLPPRSAPAATNIPPEHNPETGELNPMQQTTIRPRAGFEQGASPFSPIPGVTPAAAVAAGADRGPLSPRDRPAPGEPIHADPPAFPQSSAQFSDPPSMPSGFDFSIRPSFNASRHSGAVLDNIRAHLQGLGVQAKITFHF